MVAAGGNETSSPRSSETSSPSSKPEDELDQNNAIVDTGKQPANDSLLNKLTQSLFGNMRKATNSNDDDSEAMVEEIDYYEGDVIDDLLLGAQNAARKKKATELLDEMKEADKLAGKDTAWIDEKLKDLDSFVVENTADLDELLAQETPKVAKQANKRGFEEDGDEEELPDSDEVAPSNKKSNIGKGDGNYKFVIS